MQLSKENSARGGRLGAPGDPGVCVLGGGGYSPFCIARPGTAGRGMPAPPRPARFGWKKEPSAAGGGQRGCPRGKSGPRPRPGAAQSAGVEKALRPRRPPPPSRGAGTPPGRAPASPAEPRALTCRARGCQAGAACARPPRRPHARQPRLLNLQVAGQGGGSMRAGAARRGRGEARRGGGGGVRGGGRRVGLGPRQREPEVLGPRRAAPACVARRRPVITAPPPRSATRLLGPRSVPGRGHLPSRNQSATVTPAPPCQPQAAPHPVARRRCHNPPRLRQTQTHPAPGRPRPKELSSGISSASSCT